MRLELIPTWAKVVLVAITNGSIVYFARKLFEVPTSANAAAVLGAVAGSVSFLIAIQLGLFPRQPMKDSSQ